MPALFRFNVELDPELWCEITDGVGVATSLVGRVMGGDIEWAALRAWHEFQQADKVDTLGVEEAIVQLCDATRCAYTRGRFEPHQRLDRCVAYLDAHLMEAHRLAGVARIAGVHPIHLAKLFRRRFQGARRQTASGDRPRASASTQLPWRPTIAVD